ncbi:MAG: ATP-binding protein, partial [Bacteriovoracia bacterium]
SGGWPELQINPGLNVIQYLNDYIRTYIEKDIAHSAGIQKMLEFLKLLGLLAARTGQLLNYDSLANDAGVSSVIVKDWISMLEKSGIVYLLRPLSSNLNKRLTKSCKIYFLDTGLACRLQGWQESKPMQKSPQFGHLFETLVLAEIVKAKDSFLKNWNICLFRTKDQEELDFVLENGSKVVLLEVKLGSQKIPDVKIPNSLKKIYPNLDHVFVVSYGGERKKISPNCTQIPIKHLTTFLNDENSWTQIL